MNEDVLKIYMIIIDNCDNY